MALRRAIILSLLTLSGVSAIIGTPRKFQELTFSGWCFLFAYVYAQLTRPKEPK